MISNVRTKHFADQLIENIRKKNSVVVVGLDPTVQNVPKHLLKEAREKYGNSPEAVAFAFMIFNKRIIDALSDLAVAVKPQIAFYEQYGYYGIRALIETIEYAKRQELIVIVDAKRNDIGSTAEAYASAYLGKVDLIDGVQEAGFDVDAITVNPYLGYDCVKPFVEMSKVYGKGIFVLVKTSNPSSSDFQDVTCGRKRLFEKVAEQVDVWGAKTEGQFGYRSIGAVVGATYPREASVLREILKKSLFLVPGYGAQGATAEDVLPCFNNDGLGAVISSSRDIIFAYQRKPWNEQFSELQFDKAARQSANAMKDSINVVLDKLHESR